MTEIEMVELQKLREMGWVEEGRQRFLKHLEWKATQGSVIGTPASTALLKMCFERFRKALEDYVDPTKRGVMKDPVVSVLAILRPEHVAAITLHQATQLVWREASDREPGGIRNILNDAKTLGEALEHDVRFRVWQTEATDSVEKEAIARLRKQMKGDRSTWMRRLRQLREVGTNPWATTDTAVIGANLLKALADACPDVFVVSNVRYGGKTYLTLRLTDEAAETLADATTMAALASPRLGMMIVKPRPWRYAE